MLHACWRHTVFCVAQTAVLFVRPRGWHLLEKHMHVDGQAVPAAIFDFALYFFHNAKELLKRNTGEPIAASRALESPHPFRVLPAAISGPSPVMSRLNAMPLLCSAFKGLRAALIHILQR